jgi:hypothetical protein
MPIASQHRLAADYAGLAHPLVTGVQNEIRAGLVQPPASELRQPLVEPRVDRADRRGPYRSPGSYVDTDAVSARQRSTWRWLNVRDRSSLAGCCSRSSGLIFQDDLTERSSDDTYRTDYLG